MNYPRVNLLKKGELRYQGLVSHRVILLAIIAIPLFFSSLFLGVGLLQKGKAVSRLQDKQVEWKTVEPQFNLYRKELQRRNDARQALELMQAWKDSEISISGLLLAIQKSVPESIQLLGLTLNGDYSAGTLAAVKDFSIEHRLLIQGVSKGEEAEASVIGFRRDLMESERVVSVFQSIKLASMRKRTGTDGKKMRDFSIAGFSGEGE